MRKWWDSLSFDGRVTTIIIGVFVTILLVVIATVRPDPPCFDVAFVAPVASATLSCPHKQHHGALVPIETDENAIGVSLMCMCHDSKDAR